MSKTYYVVVRPKDKFVYAMTQSLNEAAEKAVYYKGEIECLTRDKLLSDGYNGPVLAYYRDKEVA